MLRSHTLSPLPLTLALALTSCVVACFGCDDTARPPPFPPFRPNTTCAEACAHRATLGCKDAAPTKKGTSCEAVCTDVNTSGLARWPTDCLVVTRTCAEEASCTIP